MGDRGNGETAARDSRANLAGIDGETAIIVLACRKAPLPLNCRRQHDDNSRPHPETSSPSRGRATRLIDDGYHFRAFTSQQVVLANRGDRPADETVRSHPENDLCAAAGTQRDNIRTALRLSISSPPVAPHASRRRRHATPRHATPRSRRRIVDSCQRPDRTQPPSRTTRNRAQPPTTNWRRTVEILRSQPNQHRPSLLHFKPPCGAMPRNNYGQPTSPPLVRPLESNLDGLQMSE